jgi:hypothetical protein
LLQESFQRDDARIAGVDGLPREIQRRSLRRSLEP